MLKRLATIAILVVAASIFAACSADVPTDGLENDAQDAVETVTGSDSLPEAAVMAQRVLADELAATPADIQVVSTEQVEWPNACLGLAEEGEMCAEVITPGFLVTLEVNGQQYQVHTDETGGNVRIETDMNN